MTAARPGIRILCLVSLLSVTAACGSTVSLNAGSQSSGNVADGLQGNTQTNGSNPTGAGAQASGGVPASGSGTTGPQTASGLGSQGAGSAASSGSASGKPDITGPGVTATTITIGLVYLTNSEAANEAIGANGLTAGNDEAEVKILVDDINKHGGVAGRKLVILPYGEDGTSAQPYAVTAQQMCAFMTQDHKVLAVILGGSFGDPKACLNHAGTSEFAGDLLGVSDSDGHSQIDLATGAMNFDRSMLAAVRAWTIGDWYAPWNTSTGAALPQGQYKMGVLTVDEPVLNHAVDKVLIPALVRAGHKAPDPQDIIRLNEPASAGDDGNVLAQIQNSVLKFRQDNVDHVVVMDSNGSATMFFANDAYSQHYYPRLGGGSGNAMQALLETGNIQQQSVVGAVAAGWAPVLDVPYGSGGKYESPAASRCRTLMKNGGQTFSNANAEGYALGYCDALAVLANALNNAPYLNAAGLAQGAEKIGRSLPSALTVGLDIGPGRHDAVGAFYSNVYNSGCSCFGYRGARQLI
jgi:ABC-type branched-subunit amino acid transport system substrate-binding protein